MNQIFSTNMFHVKSVLLVWSMGEGPSGSWLPHVPPERRQSAAKVVGRAEEGTSRYQSSCGLSVWTVGGSFVRGAMGKIY